MAGSLTAKRIRLALEAIKEVETVLEQHASLLHRLYYKSKAQHRSAKWFQPLDGVRKCFRRLMSDVSEAEGVFTTSTSRFTAAIQVDSSLPNRAGHAERRARNIRRFTSANGKGKVKEYRAQFRLTRSALVDVWCAFWGDEGNGRSGVPKYDRPPTTSPPVQTVRVAIFQLLRLVVLLEELSYRSQLALSVLSAQLRTPPAPTFAALVSALCTLMAVIHHSVQLFLWGSNELDSAPKHSELEAEVSAALDRVPRRFDDAVAPLYMHLFHSLGDFEEQRRWIVDAKSKTKDGSKDWETMIARIQRCVDGGQHDLTWMPHVLLRASTSAREDGKKQDAKGEAIREEENYVPLLQSSGTEQEDTGEVVG